MGGFVGDEEPEGLRWIKALEERLHPPKKSLFNMCAHVVANNLKTTLLKEYSRKPLNQLLVLTPSDDEEEEADMRGASSNGETDPEKPQKWGLRSDVRLPVEVSQRVFDLTDEVERALWDSPLNAWASMTAFGSMWNPLPLERLSFQRHDNPLSSRRLARYLKAQTHTLLSLDISGCRSLTQCALMFINRYGRKLRTLIIGNAGQILLPRDTYCHPAFPLFLISGPQHLEKLVVHGLKMEIPQDEFYMKVTGNHEKTLTHLDLSGCEISNFRFLMDLSKLKTLVLYNVDLGEKKRDGFFDILPCMSKSIRYLDLSQPANRLSSWSSFRNPNALLDLIVRTLRDLTVLDISGTNLAGDGVAQQVGKDTDSNDPCCDIPGLNSRTGRPLEYLGLYGAAHDASHRHCIPAKIVGGDKDEMQIINAARMFMDRQEVLEKILNDLFHLFRTEEGKHVGHCLRLILCAMERHASDKHIQISGSASLFYIVKNNQNLSHVAELKGRILDSIVTAMEHHLYDSTMARNGCLTICHFKIPHDVMFLYGRLVKILLETLVPDNQSHVPAHEDFNERIAIYLLNSLACQVEGEQKLLVGELGAIWKMLQLIQNRLNRKECDDVMEIAWSTMWNVTDETPENCNRFLENEGMNLFLKCLHAFPNQPELLRNMMGLLGNVAEVEKLRKRLMTEAFIRVFYDLLNSKQDNIEVSYNAAGVLAHILSDGKQAWTGVVSPTREEVCERMSQNIREWDLKSARNINYRSFKPILRLLLVEDTVQCRLWAAWALANLTTVYPDKYVRLLEEEDGLRFLEPHLTNYENPELVQYAQLACDNVKQYNPNGSNSRTRPLLG